MKPWRALTRQLLDTHCHVFDYQDPEAVLAAVCAADMRVHVMSQSTAEFATNAEHCDGVRVRPALGLFPTLVTPDTVETLVAEFAAALPRTRLVGEVGLDFVTDDPALRSSQILAFREVLALCDGAGRKVLSVHSRRSAAEAIEVVQAATSPVILHWFSGTVEQVLRAGTWFSVNAAMLRSRKGRERVAAMPRERVLLETDGPYVTVGGRPGQPLDLRHVAEGLARLWEVSLADAVERLAENGRELFSAQS